MNREGKTSMYGPTRVLVVFAAAWMLYGCGGRPVTGRVTRDDAGTSDGDMRGNADTGGGGGGGAGGSDGSSVGADGGIGNDGPVTSTDGSDAQVGLDGSGTSDSGTSSDALLPPPVSCGGPGQ